MTKTKNCSIFNAGYKDNKNLLFYFLQARLFKNKNLFRLNPREV